jgi:cytochrome c oxidase assembly protein subunit 15
VTVATETRPAGCWSAPRRPNLFGVNRLRVLVRRIRRDGITPAEYRRVCIAAFALLCIIVVTGAAVRLTGSGLGCNDWPNCNSTEFVDVATKHAAIEQINRLFTGLVAVVVILAVLGSLLRNPRRRDLTWLSVGLVGGVLGQVVLGGITVKVHLHPVAVQSHMLVSMLLVANAVVLMIRAGQPDEGRRINAVVPRVRARVRLVMIWTALAIVAGTVVTGTGPHAGDEKARRFDLAITTVTRVHSLVVWGAVASALLLMWHLRKLPHDRQVLDAPIVAWFVAAFAQGAIGYVQYFAGIPAGLVAIHVAGATTLWAVTVWLMCSTRKVSMTAPQMLRHHAARTEHDDESPAGVVPAG